jgi:hypothetical protein
MNEELPKANIEVVLPDLAGMVKSSLEEAFAYDKVKALIDKNCMNLVEETIKNQFTWHGKIKDSVEALLKSHMSFDASQIPPSMFPELLLNGLQQAIKSFENEEVARKMEEMAKSMIASAPKEIKLSKLCEQFDDHLRSYFYSELDDLKVEIDYDSSSPTKNYEMSLYSEQRWPDDDYWVNHVFWAYGLENKNEKVPTLLLEVNYKEERDDNRNKVAVKNDDGYKIGRIKSAYISTNPKSKWIT